jgi:hypothetical protein
MLLAAFALLLVFSPVTADACSACYGKSNDKMAIGLNWGILALLVFICSVLAAIAAFFIYIVRRAAALERAAAPIALSELPNKA